MTSKTDSTLLNRGPGGGWLRQGARLVSPTYVGDVLELGRASGSLSVLGQVRHPEHQQRRFASMDLLKNA